VRGGERRAVHRAVVAADLDVLADLDVAKMTDFAEGRRSGSLSSRNRRLPMAKCDVYFAIIADLAIEPDRILRVYGPLGTILAVVFDQACARSGSRCDDLRPGNR